MWSRDESAIRTEVVYHQASVREGVLKQRLAAAAVCCAAGLGTRLISLGAAIRRGVATRLARRAGQTKGACYLAGS